MKLYDLPIGTNILFYGEKATIKSVQKITFDPVREALDSLPSHNPIPAQSHVVEGREVILSFSSVDKVLRMECGDTPMANGSYQTWVDPNKKIWELIDE